MKKLFQIILIIVSTATFFGIGTKFARSQTTYPDCLHFEITFNATGWDTSTMGRTYDVGCAGDYGPHMCRGEVKAARPGQTVTLDQCTCYPYGDSRFGNRGCVVFGHNLEMADYWNDGIKRRRVVQASNNTKLPNYCTITVKGTTYDYRKTDIFPTEDDYNENNNATFCGPNGTERNKSFSITCISPTPTVIPPTPTPTVIPPTPTPTVIPPTPTPGNDGWIQGTGGDMRLDRHGPENNNIILSDVKYFSESFPNIGPTILKHGVVFLVDTFNLSVDGLKDKEKSNKSKWLVKNTAFNVIEGKELNTSYANVTNSLRKSENLNNPKDLKLACEGNLNPCKLSTSISQGVYTANGNVVIDTLSDTFSFQNGDGHKYYIFLIKGNLTIKSNIIVPKGTVAIFIVGKNIADSDQGNILVDENVSTIEGIYSADQHFTVESKTPEADNILTINGSVIANAKKILNAPGIGIFSGRRNLGVEENKTTAGIQINYRPDFVLNSPLLIRTSNSRRIEVAPGATD